MPEPKTLSQIPTHLIAGPLGAGKTSLLTALLAQRPPAEHWAILVNEFGQVGVDAALLGTTGHPDVTISEIPGGCLCCVNGVPFQVGLGRLLRRSRPDRLFIETSGLGHPAALVRQLAEPPWRNVLHLHPLVMVLDAASLAAGGTLAGHQSDALHVAGMLLMNKAETLDSAARASLAQRLPRIELMWCSHGQIPFDTLPLAALHELADTPETGELPDGPQPPPRLWRSTDDWLRREQQTQSEFSVGWQMHPSIRFDRHALHGWLLQANWIRAKAVVHTASGWLAVNGLPGSELTWSVVGPRGDNRLELIMTASIDVAVLEDGLRRTVVGS
ncbi:cobalamin biosynthesis protein CobW [Halopseudomonas nanhaiensis]|uniref:CobW family GTP-binding protein n=1 Tax=Halopseudomonas nanhaiensis TaxID=2830842 RepID=UPI001CC0E06F|nr:GTP-binding protein [Halopseudomonas nanhaiensis]UAW98391.1 cobalamin biosynthesis protein CobW [Halopseudomonas nanhaiensis]